eukprot:TRINITY_DN13489_c0_g2_i1.p1 TRINITY_DN13489_c0_g2~~TRINITY_DN13489_c0_g2_i1.p1  ORF type:complete len:169 (+),score=34.43 TRINITY_DN13489_c0_g2_i1:47-508(+)
MCIRDSAEYMGRMFLINLRRTFARPPKTFSLRALHTITDEVSLTDRCWKKLEQKLGGAREGSFLRIIVEGGEGCSGYKYVFKIDDTINEDDAAIIRDGKKYLVVDELTLKLIKGSAIDYEDVMVRSAFVVQDNPNAEKSCSCKVSFAPKEGLL